jgi:large subunit ribosomal protein L13
MIVIDAKDLIVGRLATYCAKEALLGEKIAVVNCKGAVLTGGTKSILKDIREQRERGNPFKGPFFPKGADRIMKRTIRGMLPYKSSRGRDALSNVKCYVNVPKGLEKEKLESLDSAHSKNTKSLKLTTLKTVSESMGVNYG